MYAQNIAVAALIAAATASTEEAAYSCPKFKEFVEDNHFDCGADFETCKNTERCDIYVWVCCIWPIQQNQIFLMNILNTFPSCFALSLHLGVPSSQGEINIHMIFEDFCHTSSPVYLLIILAIENDVPNFII